MDVPISLVIGIALAFSIVVGYVVLALLDRADR